ncbi:hypothetical protein DRE_07759 [Drechslerella stenobrocha 248]|uniref:Multicopper oxidase n=1 Tax=Drechslerella stenobrocha 248 TaxID=1043628 RepID=W7I874_9PEZI|nr:hypothetical protein DRE_07759 [Drechslerella stenobrocha 248]
MASPNPIKLQNLAPKKDYFPVQHGAEYDDDEQDIEDEAAGLVQPTRLQDVGREKWRALFRSILLLLASAILTITVGATLTKFAGALDYPHKLRIFHGFQPSWNFNASQKAPTHQFGNVSLDWSRSFMRDPAEYILKRPSADANRKLQMRMYDWTITDMIASPDGVMRPMLLINGQFPGPLIECIEGDVVKIMIRNNASMATAFHWHGIIQNTTGWWDGVPGVTQCPIPPGGSFQYEFVAGGQYGTYWYHAHFSTQYTDGLFGPLVIHSAKEPGIDRYQTDQVVMVHDHYHELSRNKLYEYLAPDSENNEPIPDGALINGRGIRDCSKIDSKYSCNSTGVELAEINIPRDSSHRLRFINVGAFAEFEVGLDGHSMEVIEADGTPLVPKPYQKLRINVAQRYSVIVRSNVAGASEFWLRAKMINHCFSDPEAVVEPEVKAIVRYAPLQRKKKYRPGQSPKVASKTASALPLPTTPPWNQSDSVICKDEEGSMQPAVAITAPEPDLFFYLRSNFQIGNYSLSRGFFNSSTWKTDLRNPAFDRVHPVRGNESAEIAQLAPEGVMHDIFDPKDGMVIKINGTKVVDLLIDNFDDGNHPMHLHGHKFWVMAQGDGYFNRSDYKNLPREGRLVRDTVTIEGYGYVLIRFIADHGGMWAFHCHNVWHAEAGLTMAFLTRLDLLQKSIPDQGLLGFCSHPNATAGWFDDVKEVVPPEWRHKNGED